jgi:ABC-2 type transport system permease protein
MMNTIALNPPRFSPLRCYALEARHEFLRLARTPMFCVPTLVFPAVFYLLFAVMLNPGTAGSGGTVPGIYMLATFGVYGVMTPGLFGFGVSVALDRERGWLTLKRALPMPAGAYLGAKLLMAMLFAAAIFAILGLLGTMCGGVRLSALAWLRLLLTEVFGVLPFCAIGLFLGARVSAQAAPAVANLIYLPMAFFAGLWVPLAALPALLQTIAPVWPPYHLAQLALRAVDQPATGSTLGHVAVLAAITAVFFMAARGRLARAAAGSS